MLPCESRLSLSCKTPALVTVQRAALWGPCARASCRLGRTLAFGRHTCSITGAHSGSAGSKHKGLHPPRKLAAKATWLWGLGGKQGTEASPLAILKAATFTGKPVNAQPGRHSVLQCRPLRLQTLCRKATRAFRLAALLSPEEKSKQSRQPNGSFKDARDRLPPCHALSQLSFS